MPLHTPACPSSTGARGTVAVGTSLIHWAFMPYSANGGRTAHASGANGWIHYGDDYRIATVSYTNSTMHLGGWDFVSRCVPAYMRLPWRVACLLGFHMRHMEPSGSLEKWFLKKLSLHRIPFLSIFLRKEGKNFKTPKDSNWTEAKQLGTPEQVETLEAAVERLYMEYNRGWGANPTGTSPSTRYWRPQLASNWRPTTSHSKAQSSATTYFEVSLLDMNKGRFMYV